MSDLTAKTSIKHSKLCSLDAELGRLAEAKREAVPVNERLARAILMNDPTKLKRASQLTDCDSFLIFEHQRNRNAKDGESADKYKLHKANDCTHRLCPICARKRAMKRAIDVMLRIMKLKAEVGTVSGIFLTLTVRNAPLKDLRETMRGISAAWHRFIKFPELSKVLDLGWVRSVEFFGDHTAQGECHPHIHCLILVKPSYFCKDYYIKQETWRELWQKAMRTDYVPVVHVTRVRPKRKARAAAGDGSSLQIQEQASSQASSQDTVADAFMSAVCEVCKYEMTAADLDVLSDADLALLLRQIKGLRSFAIGGRIKDFSVDMKEWDRLIDDGGDWEFVEYLHYAWNAAGNGMYVQYSDWRQN